MTPLELDTTRTMVFLASNESARLPFMRFGCHYTAFAVAASAAAPPTTARRPCC